MNAPPSFRRGQLPAVIRTCVRYMHNRRPKLPTTGFQGPDRHGEKLWVFTHRQTAQVIYSLKPTLDGFHDLKQLPFNGKKTKPAKLRKDYWSPMATIEFGEGDGAIGRSVFQKLRELKHLHEVAWPDDFRYKTPDNYTSDDKRRVKKAEANGNVYRPMRDRREKGIALNAQKPNAIADMAAVLAGAGRGNRIFQGDTPQSKPELQPAVIQWANDQDRKYAEEWSANVFHELFDNPKYTSTVDEPEVQEIAAETTPPTVEEGAQMTPEAQQTPAAQESAVKGQPKAEDPKAEKQPQKDA